MDRDKFYNRVMSVISTCKTADQLKSAETYVGYALDHYQKEYGSIGYVKLMVNAMYMVGFTLGKIKYSKKDAQKSPLTNSLTGLYTDLI